MTCTRVCAPFPTRTAERALAERRGVKASALLLMLVREEAERVGEPNGAGTAVTRTGPRGPRKREAPAKKPELWEDIVALGYQALEEDPTPMPSDLTEKLDHYVYGTPKR